MLLTAIVAIGGIGRRTWQGLTRAYTGRACRRGAGVSSVRQTTARHSLTLTREPHCDCGTRLYLKELRPTGRHPSPDTPPPGQEPKLRQQLSTPSMRSLGCFFVARAGLIDGPSLLRVPETFRPQVTLHTCVRAQTGGARRPTIIPKVWPTGQKGFPIGAPFAMPALRASPEAGQKRVERESETLSGR
jgi:hypothetical protein